MKKLAAIAGLALLSTGAFAQGTVDFLNNATTLISAGGVATGTAAQGYYFGLFTAPVGTTDLKAFTFSGLYATNQTVAGRFTGGTSKVVSGWAPDSSKNYFVAGWSASLGHDYQNNWVGDYVDGLWLNPPAGFFGVSAVATGVAGGGPNSTPAWKIFGAAPSLTAGINLTAVPVPEPTSMALAGLGAAAMLIFRRRK